MRRIAMLVAWAFTTYAAWTCGLIAGQWAEYTRVIEQEKA